MMDEQLRQAAEREHAEHDPASGPCPCPRVACTLARLPVIHLGLTDEERADWDELMGWPAEGPRAGGEA